MHDGRRCYALFHHSLSTQPLAFIHVALTNEISSSMRDINLCKEVASPSSAIFYSVNSPHPSLTGLDLATQLIHRVALELSKLHPTLQYYSTLSPIPGFMDWLREVCTDRRLDALRSRMPKKHFDSLKAVHSLHMGNVCEMDDEAIFIWLHNMLSMSTPMWTLDDKVCEGIREPVREVEQAFQIILKLIETSSSYYIFSCVGCVLII